jgi:hypothetical protein
MIDIDTFKKKYILFDFDDMLFAQNNTLVNDEKMYLSVKKMYFDKTNCNLKSLENLYSQLKKLQNTSSGIILFGIEDSLLKIKKEMKQIIINQQKQFQTFTDHIVFLNNFQKELQPN